MSHSTTGTPQGGVISPLLANIYLHEVLDRWWSVSPTSLSRTPGSTERSTVVRGRLTPKYSGPWCWQHSKEGFSALELSVFLGH